MATPCYHCKKEFETNEDYAKHLLKDHPNDTTGVKWANSVLGKSTPTEKEGTQSLGTSENSVIEEPERLVGKLGRALSGRLLLDRIALELADEIRRDPSANAYSIAKRLVQARGVVAQALKEDFLNRLVFYSPRMDYVVKRALDIALTEVPKKDEVRD